MEVAFTLNLHVNEKKKVFQCLMHLCKIVVALVKAELWDVFQHCGPLVVGAASRQIT